MFAHLAISGYLLSPVLSPPKSQFWMLYQYFVRYWEGSLPAPGHLVGAVYNVIISLTAQHCLRLADERFSELSRIGFQISGSIETTDPLYHRSSRIVVEDVVVSRKTIYQTTLMHPRWWRPR